MNVSAFPNHENDKNGQHAVNNYVQHSQAQFSSQYSQQQQQYRPLYRSGDKSSETQAEKKSFSLLMAPKAIQGWLRLIVSDKNARNLFFFLVLNLGMAFVELFYGVWTNSLGLISDSFHMFFDCTALLAGLIATLVSKWKANQNYSYGFVRAETIAGFVNALFLVFIALFIFSEGIERMVEPPEVKHERLFLVSVAGFIVNLIGIFVFQHGGGHGEHGHCHGHSHGGHGHSHGGHGHSHGGHGHSHGGHGHSHGGAPHSNGRHSDSEQLLIDIEDSSSSSSSGGQIMEGVFLHILADTLGSVGVIISAGLIHYFGWMLADPICSMFIAVLILISVVPLLKGSLGILMQRQPTQLDSVLPTCYQKVQQIDGVYSLQEQHFWTLCSNYYVGNVKIEVSPRANAKSIIDQANFIFSSVGVKQVYIQIDFADS